MKDVRVMSWLALHGLRREYEDWIEQNKGSPDMLRNILELKIVNRQIDYRRRIGMSISYEGSE